MKKMSDIELVRLALTQAKMIPYWLDDDTKNETELLSRLARGRKAIEAMGKLEWSAVHDYSTGWPCCPICRGIKPGYGKDSKGNIPVNSGHRESCYFYLPCNKEDDKFPCHEDNCGHECGWNVCPQEYGKEDKCTKQK